VLNLEDRNTTDRWDTLPRHRQTCYKKKTSKIRITS